MTSKLNEISPRENLIHQWMGYCDRVFHWIIALLILSIAAGIVFSGTALGISFFVLASALFCLVILPFIAIKIFTPGKIEPKSDN